MVSRHQPDIAKLDIVNAALVAQLDPDPPRAGADFAALEKHVVNIFHRLGSDFDAAVLRLNYTIMHTNPGRNTIAPLLAGGLDHDRVIPADDVTIANFHVAAMVGIDAVAVRHVQEVADLQPVYEDVFAADHVQPPLRG